jgi:prepilin-type N-terminal cleavage/methylation domain-containing protein/prepilin-type processing-associated H-X9-DG protein
MSKEKAFTLIELLVVISVIALLMTILFPVMGRAREAGKRTVCLSNLKTLQLAWGIYADDNNDKIVNGCAVPGVFDEPPWVGYDTLDGSNVLIRNGGDINGVTKINQIRDIQSGALYPYVRNVKAYHCPNSFKGCIRTYSIAGSMRPDSIKSKLQIKNPASRMVFVDVGKPTGGYFIKYEVELWHIAPPCRHIDGNTFSFADGHAEFWKWQGADTIATGLSDTPSPWRGNQDIIQRKPTTNGGFKDLHKTQIAVWGGLGYTPTPTE